MQEEKRFTSKTLKILLFIVLNIIAIIIVHNVFFDKVYNEKKLQSGYEAKKVNCELLQTTKEAIEEGVGINTKKIPANINYRIYTNNKENIIFYYYIKGFETIDGYSATITLSNHYDILKESYSNKTESFNEYVKERNVAFVYIATLEVIALEFVLWIIFSIFKKKYKM